MGICNDYIQLRRIRAQMNYRIYEFIKDQLVLLLVCLSNSLENVENWFANWKAVEDQFD